MTTNIYVLKLEGGNYYVGKSDDVIERFKQHIDGKGSAWTKKHRPLSLVEFRDNVSPLTEDMVTKQYMAKHGIDKVRGGSYVTEELDEFQRESIQKELWNAADCCTQCGHKGHFVAQCNATTDVNGKRIEYEESEDEWGCSYYDRTFTSEYGCGVHERSCKSKQVKVTPAKKGGTCYRCGRSGHYSPDCFARTHTMGYTLDSDCESDDDSD